MKTCDEMVNSLLKRREQYLLEQKQKRKRTAAAIAVSGGYCALAAVIGTGIWHNVILSKNQAVSPKDSSMIIENSSAANSEPEKISPPVLDRSSVIWAGSDVDAEDVINSYIIDMVDAFDSFNGKVITKTLSEAFKEHDDSSVFAVAVFYLPSDKDEDFVYNGKTLGEYDRDWSKKWWRSMNMHLLRNNAEYLINGEEYYQNDYWSKMNYDIGIEHLSEIPELVSEYFVDGEFLSDEFYRDLDAVDEEYHASYDTYKQAYNAWKISRFEEEIERLKALGVNCELRENRDSFVMFVTKDELTALTFDDSGEWIFGLACENYGEVLGSFFDE